MKNKHAYITRQAVPRGSDIPRGLADPGREGLWEYRHVAGHVLLHGAARSDFARFRHALHHLLHLHARAAVQSHRKNEPSYGHRFRNGIQVKTCYTLSLMRIYIATEWVFKFGKQFGDAAHHPAVHGQHGRGLEDIALRRADRRDDQHGWHRPLRGRGRDLHRPGSPRAHEPQQDHRRQHHRDGGEHRRRGHTTGGPRHNGHGTQHGRPTRQGCHSHPRRRLALVSIYTPRLQIFFWIFHLQLLHEIQVKFRLIHVNTL